MTTRSGTRPSTSTSTGTCATAQVGVAAEPSDASVDAAAAVPADAHVRRGLALVGPYPPVLRELPAAQGLVLAEDVSAPGAVPAFDNAAMDGFAMRLRDLDGAGTTGLPLGPEVAAGPDTIRRLPAGTAAPIMTGAPIPDCADTVVPYEHVESTGARVRVLGHPSRGAHIRRRGSEVTRGQRVAAAGALLTAPLLAAVAAVGVAQVWVHRRPRVAVVTTGSELVSPGADRPASGVHDVCSTLLTGLLAADGASVVACESHPDDHVRVGQALRRLVADVDLLVTVAGISAGRHEVVRQALVDNPVVFGRVGISPGAPQGLGRLGGTTVMCLPGNPAAALVSYLVFTRPLVRRLRGLPDPLGGWSTGWLRDAVDRRPGAARLLPASVRVHDGRTWVSVCGDAHQLTAFAHADAVVRVAPGVGQAPAGSPVQVTTW